MLLILEVSVCIEINNKEFHINPENETLDGKPRRNYEKESNKNHLIL